MGPCGDQTQLVRPERQGLPERRHCCCALSLQTLLTDNDKAFSDRISVNGPRQPTGKHLFDQFCTKHHIDHRLIPIRRPQTNGRVERFDGRISEVLNTTRFQSKDDPAQTLKRYVYLYNHHIPQQALHHQPPIQALKQWQLKQPQLFHKKIVNHPGPDK